MYVQVGGVTTIIVEGISDGAHDYIVELGYGIMYGLVKNLVLLVLSWNLVQATLMS